ncbi:MAG: DNA-binding MarR family transcriptional regulator [Parvibaculaceae bacterium]|jgi:DNA-binding MarR family transcriptional regulator|tara:strand:+ start:546 stop:1076 length:531 start_codon:yes stop_codon:yes gene_type:complete
MSDFNKDAEDVLTSLRRIIRATDLQSQRLARSTGLTTSQILVLQTVEANPQVSQKRICEEISLKQATVTSILEKLETTELVTRKRSGHDRRSVEVRLTEKGAAVLKEAPKLLQEKFANAFFHLEDWERLMIKSVLERISLMLEAEGIDASPVLDIGDIQELPKEEAGHIEHDDSSQ